LTDRFAKAVIEHVGRGQYLYSCDACSRVTTEVTSIFMGPHGEKIDLCGECLDGGDDGRGRVHINNSGRWPSR
jgi:predicted SprT family Zn-dependent metalloprotease